MPINSLGILLHRSTKQATSTGSCSQSSTLIIPTSSDHGVAELSVTSLQFYLLVVITGELLQSHNCKFAVSLFYWFILSIFLGLTIKWSFKNSFSYSTWTNQTVQVLYSSANIWTFVLEGRVASIR